MINQYEGRNVFIAITVVLVILSPIFLFVAPTVIAKLLHSDVNSWFVLVWKENYWLYGTGLFLLIMASLVISIFYHYKKVAIIVALHFFLAGLFVLFLGTLPYLEVNARTITIQNINAEKKVYNWEDIAEIKYTSNGYRKSGHYEIAFKDGKDISFSENGYVYIYSSQIRKKATDMEIPYTFILKDD